MNVTFPQPPAEILESSGSPIGSAFTARFFAAKDKNSVARFPWVKEVSDLPEIHEKYTIPLEQLAGKEPLDSAVKLGWRSVEIYENGEYGARLLSQNQTTRLVSMLQYNTGPFPGSSADAFNSLKNDPRSGNYEFRFLILPQVYVAAIWLHSLQRNLFYVLNPKPVLFQEQLLLTKRQFFSRVKRLVKESIKNSEKIAQKFN